MTVDQLLKDGLIRDRIAVENLFSESVHGS